MASPNSPVDLEDLLLRCRSRNAQVYLREAIDCYRIGAYRACVITTWVAVAYDLIDKLRELSITGDVVATAKVTEYDEFQARRDTSAALKFERDLLELVHKEFQLISPQELSDLSRLMEDRNRCGHPNYNRENEAYVPPPELAKLHLRNAVEHVLERPPVQGKAALAYLQRIVEDEYFPSRLSDAERVLRGTPLLNPKPRLVKDFLRGCLLSILREDLGRKKLSQRLSASMASYQLHPDLAKACLEDNFNQDVFKTDGKRSDDVIWLLRFWNDLQVHLKEATWTKLKEYLSNVPDDGLASINSALYVSELRPLAVEWIKNATQIELAKLLDSDSALFDKVFKDRAIELYTTATTWESAKFIASNIIQPLSFTFDKIDARNAILAGKNEKVFESFNFGSTVWAIQSTGVLTPEEFKQVIIEGGLLGKLGYLIPSEPEDWDEDTDGE